MKYTGPIFRPPVEAMMQTKLLQVTVACAHNACSFCTMYRSVNFSVESLEQIETDVIELRETYEHIPRIFLVNGDAFVLSANRLKSIAEVIIKHIPEIEVITMYASMNNIKSKTDEELKMLKEYRINDLWMGTETGLEDAIINMNKGHTLTDAYTQLERLNKVGIRHDDGFMLGVAGHNRGIENEIETAKLINDTKPSIIWFGTLGIFDGSPLNEQVTRGEFIPATELEILEEEIKILELLEVANVPFYGIHPTNASSVQGVLPRDKEVMISKIKAYINQADEAFLQSSKKRYTL